MVPTADVLARNSKGIGGLYSEAFGYIQITDMNEPPAMTDSLMEIGMGTGVNDEGDATVTSIGVPIGSVKEEASDEDTAHGDKLSFAITGGNIYKGVNPFAVNSDTGQLSVVQPLAATAECFATEIGLLTVCGDTNKCCMTAVFDEKEIETDPPYQYQLILKGKIFF